MRAIGTCAFSLTFRSSVIRLGIALDDTTIRVGLVEDEAVRVLHEEPMPAEEDADDALERICALIDRLPIVEAESIGVSMPDRERAVAERTRSATALGAELEAHYGVPTVVQDAAHCFAMAESCYGSGQGQSPVVGIRVGHRLDGGIVVNGRLLSGHTGAAGRFGRASYLDGTFDDYCGGRFLERHHDTTAMEAIEQAEAGEGAAAALLAEMGTHLGRALWSVCCAVDPACIVIGGRLAQAHPFFEAPMREAFTSEGGPAALDALSLHRSTLRHVEVLGAAALGRAHATDASVAS